MGFPIRKSTDQSFFAAPRGLSQRSTSFIASQRQGIHQTPLFHLIALIINAHPLDIGFHHELAFALKSFDSERPACFKIMPTMFAVRLTPTLLRLRERFLARANSVTISSSRCQTTRACKRRENATHCMREFVFTDEQLQSRN